MNARNKIYVAVGHILRLWWFCAFTLADFAAYCWNYTASALNVIFGSEENKWMNKKTQQTQAKQEPKHKDRSSVFWIL